MVDAGERYIILTNEDVEPPQKATILERHRVFQPVKEKFAIRRSLVGVRGTLLKRLTGC